MKNLALVAATLIAAVPAQAMHGGRDTDSTYDAVGSLITFDRDMISCTATLISPEWIVTAQHCQEGGSEDEPITYTPDQFTFRLGEDSLRPIESVKLVEWIVPPTIRAKIDGQEEEFHLDVAFARLAKPITVVNGRKIRPIPLSLAPLSPSTRLEVVGYGYPRNSEAKRQHGFRQKARYQVTSVIGNAFLNLFGTESGFLDHLKLTLPMEADPEEGNIDKLILDGWLVDSYQIHAWDPRGRENGKFTKAPPDGWSNTCHGDSGGPAIATIDGKRRVVGIISGGYVGADDCVNLGSEIGVFGPLIQDLIRAHSIPVAH